MTYTRYTPELLAEVIAKCKSFSEAARCLGKKPVGGTITNMKLMCDRWSIDTSHMTGQAHNRGKRSIKRKPVAERLVCGCSTDHRTAAKKLRQALTETGRLYECADCGISEWNGKPLVLEIHHKDNQYWNNEAENLEYLCPNCHSLR